MKRESLYQTFKIITIFLGILSLLLLSLVFLLLHTFNELFGDTRLFIFDGGIIFLLLKYICFFIAIFKHKLGAYIYLVTLIIELILTYILSNFESLQISLLLKLNSPMYITIALFMICDYLKRRTIEQR